jgi:hypothetical protein
MTGCAGRKGCADARRPRCHLDRFCRDASGDGGRAGLAAARWPGLHPGGRGVRGGGGCLVDARLLPGHLAAAVVAGAAGVLVAGLYAWMSRWLHPVGAVVWSSWLLLGIALLGWGGLFLAHLHVSRATSALLWVTGALSAVTPPSAVVQTREGWGLLLRRRSRRAGRPPVVRNGRAPRVSVHVPCRAEPPQLVMATLERLARAEPRRQSAGSAWVIAGQFRVPRARVQCPSPGPRVRVALGGFREVASPRSRCR